MAPSAKSPNATSKAKLAARAQTRKKQVQQSQKRDQDKVAKRDARRGARPGLLPTSGPNRALSRKKARKVEKALAHALKRKAEAEGGMVTEGDAPDEDTTNAKKEGKGRKEEPKEEMDVDDIA
ncbi:hypothetical protein SODALDRAFT_329761 [Sodiomyces alkalinus F11]|uniref:Uncharacterized protein n=1 Tax=Sodiomyces alkalinus (strain CBS 110278 / VKM F-3762 / F11) TaxID=1314773 RepID=A0A3N2PJ97_SODAK|nr:hypothetical protein SODALDRAFT_329761 [Sodiomyces alkalinus F11]ROT34510.1 hypothetical protein SODALDRAFT_329761 [Sodiomyces alkalinus F11]